MGTKFTASVTSQTNEAVADTTNMTDVKYLAVQGAATPMTAQILEVYIGGEATASTVGIFKVARDSTVGGTLTTVNSRIAALHPSSAAARVSQFTGATTKPQRSATLHLLGPSLNLFGGIVRWVAAPGEELVMIGATASFGEISLSGYTGSGTGAYSAHLVVEEL